MTSEEFLHVWTWSNKSTLGNVSGVFRSQSKCLGNWSFNTACFLIDELHQLRDIIIGLRLGDGDWCPLLRPFAVLCSVSVQSIYKIRSLIFHCTSC